MIETEQTVTVNCGIEPTWAYARDFERWASIMPGYQTCEIEDEDNSRWILKVGVGALVRTVKVRVHVEQWAGPERVDFSFKLEGDPVSGSGSYLAAPTADGRTDMSLRVRIEGSGPMAPMWEAMGGPVLPKFAMSFAEQLKSRIEEFNGANPVAQPGAATGGTSLLARLLAWLKGLLGGK
jgi:carbon monoxide dehydrogenase subunit G